MTNSDDVRDRNDLREELTDWFWKTVSKAKKNPDIFAKLSDEELVDFAEMMTVKTYFFHDPFHPPEDVITTENSLDEAGAWVLSQGKRFFFKVWKKPELFWELYRNREYNSGPNFEFSAHKAWRDRHDTDIPLP